MSYTITGSLVADEVVGKTKIIRPIHQSNGEVLVISKNDITAGNGARHEILIGKGKLANTVTCKVFDLLKRHAIPLAYRNKFGPESFQAIQCRMIRLEVVVRFEAVGSFVVRNPLVESGDVLDPPLVEFYLKTTNRTFAGVALECDDPLVRYDFRYHVWKMYSPITNELLGVVDLTQDNVVSDLDNYGNQLEWKALQAAEILRQAWAKLGARLQDVKFEFGIAPNGELLLADVVDCDSWRLVKDGRQLSKQAFRDGASLDEMSAIYQEVAHLVHFL